MSEQIFSADEVYEMGKRTLDRLGRTKPSKT